MDRKRKKVLQEIQAHINIILYKVTKRKNEMKYVKGTKMKTNNDSAISKETEDKLDIIKYIKGLTSFVESCETPMTLAIQGGWGTGKTSMMNLLEDELRKEKIMTMYLNTWQYSQLQGDLYENFIVSIIDKILKENESQKEEILNFVKPILTGVLGLALKHVDENVDIEKIFDKKATHIEQIEEYKEYFEELIDRTLQKNNKERYVFFIDDLDRLSPDKALEVLEIIKIFFDVDKCVFILAVDYDVVVDGIRRKYGEGFKKGREFFDKIIQVPFNVPVHSYKIDVLLEDSVGDLQKDNCYKYIVDLTKLCTGSNPRTIKRVLNSYNLMKAVCGEMDGELKPEAMKSLYVIQCIQVTQQGLYDYMISEYDEFIKNISDGKGFEQITTYIKERDKSLSENTERQIMDILDTLKELIKEKDKEIFEKMITYSKQSNNTAGMATDIQINLSGKEEWVTNPTEAFRKSVEFILNNLQGDVPLESVNKWLALNKNDNENNNEKADGYFGRSSQLCGGKYIVGTYSATSSKIKQVKDLWNICRNSLKGESIEWNKENEVMLKLD